MNTAIQIIRRWKLTMVVTFIFAGIGQQHLSAQLMFKTPGEQQLHAGWNWVPTGILHGGLLLDRFGESSRIREFDGSPSTERVEQVDWWQIYAHMYTAQHDDSLFENPDTVLRTIAREDGRMYKDYEKYSGALNIIYADYSYIVEDSSDLGYLSYGNNQFLFDLNNSNQIVKNGTCFAVTVSHQELIEDELYLRVNAETFFTNSSDELLDMDIYLNGILVGSRVGWGSELLLTDLLDENELIITAYFASGAEKTCRASLKAGGLKASGGQGGTDPDLKVNRTDPTTGLEYKIGVWYGCWDDTTERKPFIVVSGFTPEFLFGTGTVQFFDWNLVSLKLKYATYNYAGLLDELRSYGYDIYIIQSDDGMISTSDLSYITEDAINWINNSSQQSNFENVTSGVSQGAIALRIALLRMEKNFLENGGAYHRCKTFISWDGEHQGMNAPIGSQAAIKRIKDKFWFTGFWINNLDHWFNSIPIREYAIYNKSNTNSVYNSPIPGSPPPSVLLPGADALYYNLQSLPYTYNHLYTEVSGYPSFVRRVGISHGSNSNTSFTLNNSLSAYSINQGTLLYTKHLNGGYSSYFSSTYQIIYNDEFHESIMFVPFGNETVYYDGAFPGYKAKADRLPGSIFTMGPLGTDMHLISCEKMADFSTFAFCVPQTQSFVPTYSGLDIKNASPYFSSANYNLVTAGLMYSNYPDVTNAKYGYPHIGLGANSLNHTPFDAVFSEAGNEFHVLESSGDLKNFIIHAEIQPNWLELQNRIVGDHLTTYAADFEAIDGVVMGQSVTVKEPVGSFVINSGTSSDIRAGLLIHMHPGTVLSPGSTVYLHLDEEVGCQGGLRSASAGDKLNDGNRINQTQTSRYEKNESKDHPSSSFFNVYPNPFNETITIEVRGNDEHFLVDVYDMQGKRVYTGTIWPGSHSINLSNLHNGMYMVKVAGNNWTETKRVIKF